VEECPVTVLIGFSCQRFTIIGADGRSIADEDRSDVDDDTQKVFKTGFGMLAGAGRSDIVEAVTRRLQKQPVVSNAEASQIIRAEVAGLDLPDSDLGLQRTCWLASYATLGAEGVETRLALATRDDGYSFGNFPHHLLVMIRPIGMSEEAGRQIRSDAQLQLETRLRQTPSEEHVRISIEMIAALVRAIARVNSTVGPRWSVGVHLSGSNATAVCDVAEDVRSLRWH
jgi:hypothetical protein